MLFLLHGLTVAMSYDLQIWSVRPFNKAMFGKDPKPSNKSHEQSIRAGSNWHIVINRSEKVPQDEVEDEIATLLPGIRYLTELNLEGNAPDRALALLRSTAREIATNIHGVIEDPQADQIITPKGITRYSAPRVKKTFKVITMSWWFLNNPLRKATGRRAFLMLLKRYLPEALPKRYGEYDPPKYELVKKGLKHLEEFIGKHLHDPIVWYFHRPAADLSLNIPKPAGPHPNGFRTYHLDVQVEVEALKEAGWPEQLHLFWREMTFFLKPIYGEVRTEDGYSRTKSGAVYVDAKEIVNDYPFTNRNWFWRGIPRKLGHAVVLGKEYQALWPDFVNQASMEKGFAFASTPDWSKSKDLTEIIDHVPQNITLLPGDGCGPEQAYPRIWPFAPPFGKSNSDC